MNLTPVKTCILSEAMLPLYSVSVCVLCLWIDWATVKTMRNTCANRSHQPNSGRTSFLSHCITQSACLLACKMHTSRASSHHIVMHKHTIIICQCTRWHIKFASEDCLKVKVMCESMCKQILTPSKTDRWQISLVAWLI